MNKNFINNIIREFSENGTVRLKDATIRYTKISIDSDGRKTEVRHTIEFDGTLEFDHNENTRRR